MKKTAIAATTLAAALTLTACGSDDTDATPAPATVTVTESANNDKNPDDDGSKKDDKDRAATTGDEEDPVFAVIKQVEDKYPGGTIVDIDRSDSGDHYDVDLVRDGKGIEVVVRDGTITEQDTDDDDGDDDVDEAKRASVSVTDAVRQALQQHPDGVLDEISLDEDDGNLHWDIDLDNREGGDLTDVMIPAL